MQPDGNTESLVSAGLERARRRLLVRHALQSIAAISAAVAVAVALRGVRSGASAAVAVLALLAVGVMVAVRARRESHRTVAAAIERRHPELHNLLVTAEEMIRHPGRSPQWVQARVLAEAGERMRALDIASVWPLTRLSALAASAIAVAAIAALTVPASRGALEARRIAGEPDRPAAMRVEALVTPPAYTRRAAVASINPDRVEGIAGSLLRLTVLGPEAVRIRFGSRPLEIHRNPRGAAAELTLGDSGYLAIDAGSPGDPSTRLIAVAVLPDRSPAVRIEQPAKDLLLPDAATAIPITGFATDDVALAALTLHYTKVSGTGEQFEFVEGDLPLVVERSSEQQWRGRGSIDLRRLDLEPGDSLVYRLLARDGRSGDAAIGSSDTYFIEIAGPGQVALEGVEMPPDQERYALSQQMIVLKIRRLREGERKLAPAAFDEQAGAIAAEQRAVRANFVFLMGGHVEDEEEEAEQSHEIQEGRLQSSSTREMSRAIAHMTAAEQGLTARDTGAALRAASLAVEALQRAFSRNRYILRTLASRTPLDPGRRLTGSLDAARDSERSVGVTTEPASVRSARALLADVLEAAAAVRSAPADARVIASLAGLPERALAVQPDTAAWHDISRGIVRFRDALAAGAYGEGADDALGPLVRDLLQQARAGAPVVAQPGATGGRLESAWTDERRRR